MRSVFVAFICLTLLSSCGLKRNLELPGREKHKHQDDQTVTQSSVSPVSTDQVTPAATPVMTGPGSSSNPVSTGN
jgi:predicted small lipoprotein YifL